MRTVGVEVNCLAVLLPALPCGFLKPRLAPLRQVRRTEKRQLHPNLRKDDVADRKDGPTMGDIVVAPMHQSVGVRLAT